MGLVLTTALAIPVHHVLLINLFDYDGVDRNDARSVRRRVIGATVSNVISVISTVAVLEADSFVSALHLLGVHAYGAVTVAAVIAAHTTVLFLPNLIESILEYDWRDVREALNDRIFYRNMLVAPIGEEVAFRACAGTLIAKVAGRTKAIVLSPLLFACCHFHMIFDDHRRGYTWSEAAFNRGFQMLYTYVFGVYAAYLYFSTGHLLAPIVCHMVCNHFGLPLITELLPRESTRYRNLQIALSLACLAAFCVLLPVCTNRALYHP